MSYLVSDGRSRYGVLIIFSIEPSGVPIIRRISAFWWAYAFFQNAGPSKVRIFLTLDFMRCIVRGVILRDGCEGRMAHAIRTGVTVLDFRHERPSQPRVYDLESNIFDAFGAVTWPPLRS